MGCHAGRGPSPLADTRRQAVSVAEDGGMQRLKESGFLRAVPAPALHRLPQGLNLRWPGILLSDLKTLRMDPEEDQR